MLQYPNIDPIALELGPLKIHWYGLMYLAAFLSAMTLGIVRARRPDSGWTRQQVEDLIYYCALGVILGGRIGYVFFYNFHYFLNDPLWLFRIWEGGMSFHGGLLGVCVAFYYFARKNRKTFFDISDFGAPLVPLGLGFGRLGNFIGGELYGRVTDAAIGMAFPIRNAAGQIVAYTEPRHPSQLYQAFLEGLVLFCVVWWYSSKPRPKGAVTGLFGMLYGLFRFIVEFFREPDQHIGFVAFHWLTMGQLLSLPMILLGVGMIYWAYRRNPSTSQSRP